MKTHTSDYKNQLKEFGREIDSKIIYTINGTTITLGKEQLNSVVPHYNGNVLKSESSSIGDGDRDWIWIAM